MQIFWISLARWFDQSVFVVWKSQQLVTQFWIHPKTEVICWFDHLRDFALPFYRNLTIQRMSRVWHQPSRVSRTYGCSELEHGTCVPLCYCGDALPGVRNPTKVDFQSPVQPCLVSAVSAHTSCNYSSDHPFYSLSLQGGVHTIEKGTRQFGVRQFGSYLTLCFFLLQDFS